MSIQEQLAHEFSRNSRHRGEEYFAYGRVQIVATTETSVVAYVVGGTRYQVRLERHDDLIVVRCTCPHFEGGSLCKHIWGTILAADSRGLLAGAAGHQHVALDWNAINDVLDELDVYDEGDIGSEAALFDDDEETPWSLPPPRPPGVSNRRGAPKPPPVPRWQQILGTISALPIVPEAAPQSAWAEWPDETLHYVIDPAASRHTGRLVVDLLWRRWRADGTRSEPKSRRLLTTALGTAPDADRRVLTALVGATAGYAAPGYGYVPPYFAATELASRYYVPGFSLEDLLPAICATGRARLRHDASMDEAPSIAWDDGPPWRFRLDVERDSERDEYLVSGVVHRDGHDRPLESFEVLFSAGYALAGDVALRLDHGNAFAWILQLRSESPLRVPAAALDELLAAMFVSGRPDVRLPEGVHVERRTAPPRPCLRVRTPQSHDYPQNALHGTLAFEYGGLVVPAGDRREAVFLAAERRIVDRDPAAERAALEELIALGAKVVPASPRGGIATHIPLKRWPAVLDATLHANWRLEADGASVRLPGETRLELTSGIDWFELDGVVDFGGTAAAARAARRAPAGRDDGPPRRRQPRRPVRVVASGARGARRAGFPTWVPAALLARAGGVARRAARYASRRSCR